MSLISAPAGHGKSILASCWIEALDIPCAWVSLDKNDNDLRLFINCCLAAVRFRF
jgi:LuxR family maltose regulon positive regulatory protein